MARDERVITVLVASPSDLEPERSRLEEIIREFNIVWSKNLRLRLELVKWETHGHPGIGEDAQDVLNQQLGDDYDVFLGMMWNKFGTPTGRAGSGTEEEFYRALARYRRDAASVKIMFYFKDAPLAPSKIKPEELANVQRFKGLLGEEGTLHWSFANLEDFERLARMHLTLQAQEFSRTQQQSPAALPSESENTAAAADTAAADTAAADIHTLAAVADDEPGLLDLMETVEECFTTVYETLERMTSETNNLRERIEKRTEEINAAVAIVKRGGKFTPKDMKALLTKAASDMNHYVVRIRPELPLYRDGLQAGIDAMVKVLLMSVEPDNVDREQLRDARGKVAALEELLRISSHHTESFRDAVQTTPRMTSKLNQAKREVVIVLDEIIGTFTTGRHLLMEALKGLDELQKE